MRKIEFIAIVVLCTLTSSVVCQQKTGDLGNIVGVYEKLPYHYHKLEIYSNHTFKSIYDCIDLCGLGDAKEIVVGTYSIDETQNILKFSPKEFKELYHGYPRKKLYNIPFDSIGSYSKFLKSTFSIITFGDDVFLIKGKRNRPSENEFLNFINSVNHTNGLGNIKGDFYRKLNKGTEISNERKSREDYRDLINNLGEIYGEYIFENGPLEIQITKIDTAYYVPKLYNPITYMEIHTGLFFNKEDQDQLRKGMVLFDKNNQKVQIHETGDRQKIGIYIEKDYKYEFRIGDFLKSNR
jgi:hypothetical protein